MIDIVKPLTKKAYLEAVNYLCAQDNDLSQVVNSYGVPNFERGKPGYGTLVRLIVEQQVSVAAGRTIFERLEALVSPLTPERLLKVSDVKLKQAGLSRQKLLYCQCLSEAVIAQSLDFDALLTMPDEGVRSLLIKVKGIGRWTADLYLLAAMRRPDIWPVGDLALDVAIQKLKRLRKCTPAHFQKVASIWGPYRSVAARIAWLYYTKNQHKRSK